VPPSAPVDTQVRDHFTARAARYNVSSHWVTDPALGALTVELLAPRPTDVLLDVACGTGLVSKEFVGKVARIVGVDITEAMFAQARPYVDELVVGAGESLPFPDASFDRVVCRQGIQFMRDGEAVREMLRVLKPGGRVCLVHLCAYGEADRPEYFESLRLRNEARRNFYVREDLSRLLTDAGAVNVAVHDYVSVEDVDVWSNTGAITDEAREGIRNVYRNASPAFQELHAVQVGDRIVDHMLFGVAVGEKRAAS
jgi:SAM-dependent methyltransferase